MAQSSAMGSSSTSRMSAPDFSAQPTAMWSTFAQASGSFIRMVLLLRRHAGSAGAWCSVPMQCWLTNWGAFPLLSATTAVRAQAMPSHPTPTTYPRIVAFHHQCSRRRASRSHVARVAPPRPWRVRWWHCRPARSRLPHRMRKHLFPLLGLRPCTRWLQRPRRPRPCEPRATQRPQRRHLAPPGQLTQWCRRLPQRKRPRSLYLLLPSRSLVLGVRHPCAR
mmetsp:Transcript_30360/g.78726  ORF Transcript_30360/g.78726 Transcript_30360/m.78726 type:complete len:221 (-) Transcript_30360:485-1147(-)